MQDAEMLNFILKNAEMGRIGIADVMQYSKDERLNIELKDEMDEYDKIYCTAREMLQNNNYEIEHVNAMAKIGSQVMTAMKAVPNHTTSKIADMMIKGNTMGVTKILQRQSEYDGNNEEIKKLANKLVITEENNIKNMKHFL